MLEHLWIDLEASARPVRQRQLRLKNMPWFLVLVVLAWIGPFPRIWVGMYSVPAVKRKFQLVEAGTLEIRLYARAEAHGFDVVGF